MFTMAIVSMGIFYLIFMANDWIRVRLEAKRKLCAGLEEVVQDMRQQVANRKVTRVPTVGMATTIQ
jgi:hypothetical protein